MFQLQKLTNKEKELVETKAELQRALQGNSVEVARSEQEFTGERVTANGGELQVGTEIGSLPKWV